MSKVIPELLRRYTVALKHPEREWKVCNRWFTQQEGLIVTLTPR